MKKLFIISVCVFLYGCTNGMTNEQIIADTKLCKDNDMHARFVQNTFNYTITKVQCVPKEANQ